MDCRYGTAKGRSEGMVLWSDQAKEAEYKFLLDAVLIYEGITLIAIPFFFVLLKYLLMGKT